MNIFDKLEDIKYWFYYRFHPTHRYNIVKLPLKAAYYECDTRLFYSVFTIFEDHVKEGIKTISGYEYIIGDDPDFEKYKNESNEEYSGLKEYFDNNSDTYTDFYKAAHFWSKIGKNIDKYIETECYRDNEWDWKREEEVYAEATQNLILIVKHWRALWT